jgi:lysophospholipase L1-like esterase
MKPIKYVLPAVLLFLFAFTVPDKKKIRVWLIGDSTMSVKEIKAYPETGWGMPFACFFDSTVTINNRARNGRSSKSFIAEKLWQPVADNLQEGDYVFIQFGHNDESKDKGERYSTPEEFRANLARYIAESRSKNAIPVLITPVARRRFDENGQVKETHEQYAALVRAVAAETGTPLIDLDEKSKTLLQQLGPETSKSLFNYLAPGEHPNYPDGRMTRISTSWAQEKSRRSCWQR